MKSYHSKNEASLKTFFRQQTKKSRAERNKWFQCIICGSCHRNCHQVAVHMTEYHSRLQMLKFNVQWICDWFYVSKSVTDVCPVSTKKISMLKLAQHSSECSKCSVLTVLMGVIGKCCDRFDDWSKKDESLKAIREATEILHGLEKLTKKKNWSTVH